MLLGGVERRGAIVVEWLLYCVVWAYYLWCFFFSSRRRHTRFDCDWSSDVCSSDLAAQPGHRTGERGAAPAGAAHPGAAAQARRCGAPVSRATAGVVLLVLATRAAPEIGRASCRERV